MGERIEGKMGKEGRDKEMLSFFFFFFNRIVNNSHQLTNGGDGLLTLFCFHTFHFPSTFLSFSLAFYTSRMVTSFTVQFPLYLPPPSQVSLLPWQQQTSE